MMTCTLCHFETALDEVVATTTAGQGVCWRCFESEPLGTRRPHARRRLRTDADRLDTAA